MGSVYLKVISCFQAFSVSQPPQVSILSASTASFKARGSARCLWTEIS